MAKRKPYRYEVVYANLKLTCVARSAGNAVCQFWRTLHARLRATIKGHPDEKCKLKQLPTLQSDTDGGWLVRSIRGVHKIHVHCLGRA